MKIKFIRKEKVNCKVYNLEVEDNPTYYANDILVHNCRSTLVPVTKYETFTPIKPELKARAIPMKGKDFINMKGVELYAV